MRSISLGLMVLLLPLATATADLGLQVEKTLLDNGLTVLTCVDQTAPTVSVQTMVNAGARDEDKVGATGLAHVFEHMMFRGTEAFPDYAAAAARLGAQNNAYTGKDYTCYFINADSRFLEQMLELESDRIRNLQFTREAFRTELGPVKEERRLGVVEDPGGFLGVELAREAYSRHTYQHPVIGWEKDLEVTMTFEDGLEFMNRFYVPNNCVLVICGNFDPEQALNLVGRYYGDWPRAEAYTPVIATEPLQTEERIKNFVWKESQTVPLLRVAYHIPSLPEDLESLVALQVIDELLCSRSGRLTGLLRDELSLVESVRGDVRFNKDPGLYVISARLRRGESLDEVRDSIYAQLELLKTVPVTSAELQRAANNLRASRIYRLNRPGRIAGTIGFFQVVGGDYSLIDRQYELYRGITPDQIMSVAAAWLDQFNRTVVTLIPKSAS